MTLHIGRTAVPDIRIVKRLGASACAVGVCAALSACSAHDRRTASSAPAATPAVAQVQPTVSAQGQPVVVASATTPLPPVAPGAAGRSVAVASVQPAASGAAKLGKSGGGLASWYGDRFHGRRTANGERFDMHTLTAAHRSFPLPSYVRVTNASNGRSVVVRVNDRGPFHGGRVIDVSRRAADVLGFRGNGVGNVKLDFVGRAPARDDDRRLLATYQEFGRPTVPPGMQMAALAPVSDAELATGAGQGGGAYAVASRAVTRSADYVMASATSAATAVKSAATATTTSARTAVRSIMPSGADRRDEPAQPTASAYAAPEPTLAAAPAAITGPAKRVVQPMQPALASATPVPAAPASEVSSRIASSFESFQPSATTVTSGASVTVDVAR